MSKMCLVATTFTTLNGDISYGYTIYDEYGHNYCNIHPSLIEDDLELLEDAITSGDRETREMLMHAKEHGIEINDTWYEPEQIQHLFTREKPSEISLW